MKILITGFNGYLARGLIPFLNNAEIVLYDHDVREFHSYDDIDMILHFASPSDASEFQDEIKTTTTIIDGTFNMVKLAQNNRCKLVYASTMGVNYVNMYDVYSTAKLAMENYIKSVYNNYTILRIPRVYSKCRTKGLMKQIRENTIPEKDMSEQIEFITLQDFIDQTLPVINLEQTKIVHEYKITNKQSLRQISTWVKE